MDDHYLPFTLKPKHLSSYIVRYYGQWVLLGVVLVS